MDIGPDGNLYVVNGGTDEILVIAPSGTVVRRWGSRGAEPGQFDFQADPFDTTIFEGGVSVGPDGSVYVADLSNSRVQQFASDGTFVRQWGSYGTDAGQFLHPLDIAVGPDASVYVVDDRGDDIQRFTADGAFVATIGSHGTGDGQLNNTGSVFVDAAGTLLNADYGNGRVQAWGTDGALLWSLGAAARNGLFTAPTDLGADAVGNLYVTDAEGLKILGPERDLLTSWTPPAAATKELTETVVVAPDGTVYIASQANGLIYRLHAISQEVEMSPPPSAPVTAAPSSTAGSTSTGPSATGALLAVDRTFAVPFTLELLPGWEENQLTRGGVAARFRREADITPAYVGVAIPINAFGDPCHTEVGPMSPPVGPTVDDLTSALTHAVGYRAGPVTDVTIDGYSGKTFELDNNVDITTCSDSTWLRQWTFDSSTGGTPVVTNNGDLPDAHQRIAILDVKGTRVMVSTWTFPWLTLADEIRQANQVFDSIHFQ